jgi:hypothetical protein
MTAKELTRVKNGCCPDCGSKDLGTEEKSDYTKEFYSVYCECSDCGASYTIHYDLKPVEIERF